MLIAFTHMTIILTLVKRVGVLMLRMFRFVATCMVTVAKKIKQCGAGGLLGSKHQGHNVSSNNLQGLSERMAKVKQFLWALNFTKS